MSATDRTQQIWRPAVSPAPFTYTVPGSTAFELLAVRGLWDGTAAAGSYRPTVQLVSDSGEIMAQTIGDTVTAGGSADATFAPFLEMPEAATPTGADLEDVILATGATALYKFDELSGTDAHDSSGNGQDLTASTLPPTWGGNTGPPGTPSAEWAGDWHMCEARGAFQALGAGGVPFSILGWFQWRDTFPAHANILCGQGASSTQGLGSGWALSVNGSSLGSPGKLQLYANNGTFVSPEIIASDNALTQNTFYFGGVTWNGTTWKMYIDALLQSTTSNRAFTPTAGLNFGSLQTGIAAGSQVLSGNLSWWAVIPGVALTSTQFLAVLAAV